TVLGLVGILVTVLAGKPLLRLLYTAEYAQHAEVLIYLAITAGMSFVASFLGFGMTAARYFRVQAPLFLRVGLVTILACAALVTSHGLPGVALATTVAVTCQLVGSALVVRHALRENRGEEASCP